MYKTTRNQLQVGPHKHHCLRLLQDHPARFHVFVRPTLQPTHVSTVNSPHHSPMVLGKSRTTAAASLLFFRDLLLFGLWTGELGFFLCCFLCCFCVFMILCFSILLVHLQWFVCSLVLCSYLARFLNPLQLGSRYCLIWWENQVGKPKSLKPAIWVSDTKSRQRKKADHPYHSPLNSQPMNLPEKYKQEDAPKNVRICFCQLETSQALKL